MLLMTNILKNIIKKMFFELRSYYNRHFSCFSLRPLLGFDTRNLPAFMNFVCLFVCLFVYIWFSAPLDYFSLSWRRHHSRWRATNFYLYSALIAIEQWGFFNVPHLLWHRPTLYNAHLRGSVTLIPIAERFGSEAVTTVSTA